MTLRKKKVTEDFSRRSFLRSAAVGTGAGMAFSGIFGTENSGLRAAVNGQSLASYPSGLKITDMKCAYMRGHGTHLFVRIYTDQGITGTGEGMDAVQGTAGLVESFKRHLIGENPLDVNRLFEKIRKAGVFGGAQAGVYVAVLSAVEIALWDLTGKALGLPIYRLMGGKYRDRIRLYCDSGGAQTDTPEHLAEHALSVKNLGFNAIKIDVDDGNDPNKLDTHNWTASPAELERMEAKVAAVRSALGAHTDLCVDMHGFYDYPTGLRVAKLLEPYNLMWLEEPIPHENTESLVEITRSTSIPICVGENLYLAHGFREVLEKRAADIVMPDIHKCGGLGEAQRIANLAHLYYVPFAPHNVACPLGTMAAAHVCASIPNFLVMEWHWLPRPEQWKEIAFIDEPVIDKGYVRLLDKPGIGIELNDVAAKRYRVKDAPFFD